MISINRKSQEAEKFAEFHHQNQLYGCKPYKYHLEKVREVAFEFRGEMSKDDFIIVVQSCWLHDVIEDSGENYNSIKREFGFDVAEVVYAVSEGKGRSRKERQNDLYYKGIKESRLGTFVKLCDKIANTRESISTNDKKRIRNHKKELDKFSRKLYSDDAMYKDLWISLWDSMGYKGFSNEQ